MRNVALHGYLIHARKYREKSHIVHLFTEEYGRIDGVLRQVPPPQYQPIVLQASGKGQLKNFSKVEILTQPVFFAGDAFFSGFYLNELLIRLCAIEEPMPKTFVQYVQTLMALQQLPEQPQPDRALRVALRAFEGVLLNELGYEIDFTHDVQGQPIQPALYYEYQLQEGFYPCVAQQSGCMHGADLLQLSQPVTMHSAQQLKILAQLYRKMIAVLLGDRPLKSRQLWVQYATSVVATATVPQSIPIQRD